MKLNLLEFLMVNNPVRAYVQERYELPILLEMLEPGNLEAVLEIGCGNGTGTRLIRKYFNPGHITAIDLDERMIHTARRRVRDAQTVFQVMDAARLEFADDAFDAIFDFGIIHHIPNWKTCIAELRRVLKPNGKLILEELSRETFCGFPGRLYKALLSHPYDAMYSAEEFLGHLRALGFEIEGFKAANPFKLIAHFSLVASLPETEP